MMSRSKKAVTGNYYPVRENGEQVVDKAKGGRKWRIEIELPQIGENKRPRKVRIFYRFGERKNPLF